MDTRAKLQWAAILAAIGVGAIGVGSRLGEKNKCVIPDCDASQSEVDCYRKSKGPMLDPEVKPRWIGCNVFPASEAVGKKCIPAACVIPAGNPPRLLE
jgi:hypothetical protein